MSESLWPHGLQHARPLSFTVSQSLLKLMTWNGCHPSSVIPFSCLQSFPASGSFPMSWLFTSGEQSFLQHHSWKHQFFGTQPSLWSNCHICAWLLEKPWATSMSAESVLGRKLFWYGLAIIGEASYHISVYRINEIWGAFKDYALIYFSLNSLPVNLSQTWIKWVLNLSKWFKNYTDTCVFKRQNLFLELAGAIHVE